MRGFKANIITEELAKEYYSGKSVKTLARQLIKNKY